MRHVLVLNERDIHHPSAGGAEVNLFEVCRRLVNKGYRVTVLCTRFPGAQDEETIDGVQVVRFGNRLSYYLRIVGQVRRHVTPDTVVIEHLCKLPFCSPLYVDRPVLPVTHHLFGRTVFYQAPAPVAAAIWGSERLIPSVYRHCQFVAVSPSTRDDLIERGVDGSRIRVIPNGVDCAHYTPPAERPAGPPRLLAFGRIEPYKRLDLVLQAFERVRRDLPQARLDIIGGGTGLAEVRAGIDRLGLRDSVTCPGPVDENHKLDSIHRADMVVNTSEKEGWGLTVLEAAACERPTVASNVPGLRDAILDGRTGVLVPHGDVAQLAATLTRLLRDTDERQRLGVAARAWAGCFSWDTVAEATAACIEEICGTRPAAATAPVWFTGLATRQG